MHIHIPLPPYLQHWLRHRASAPPDATTPIDLPRGSLERIMLALLLTPRPKNQQPTPPRPPKTITIKIPAIRGHNPQTYNHLPTTHRKQYLTILRALFDTHLLRHMRHPANQHQPETAAIEQYLKQNNISAQHFDTIKKRWQRILSYKKKG